MVLSSTGVFLPCFFWMAREILSLCLKDLEEVLFGRPLLVKILEKVIKIFIIFIRVTQGNKLQVMNIFQVNAKQ